jgi:hypothetical protein
MTDLSPAARATYDAFNRVGFSLEPSFETDRKALSAAIRAVADQVVPSDAMEPRNYIPIAIECQRIRAELLAIADELEGITYGTYRCDLETQ